MQNDTRYISVGEAAKKWGVSVRSVQIACQKGNIPGVNLKGKAWCIPVDADKPSRKPRAKGRPKTILAALLAEKRARIKGALYHRLQIDFTYNTNHMEGSRLTHDQTRWIFETQTVGKIPEDIPVDDLVETVNHFRCIDLVLESAGAALSERYIKMLHAQLKSGTADSRKEWFSVGDYKKLDNVVGDMETCPAGKVHEEMVKLLTEYSASGKSLTDIIDFHVRFERIHPFQEGNGRVGRLVMLKECLKYGHTPFVIAENIKQFYYLGLQDWRFGHTARLKDTCGTGQDVFKLGLKQFGYADLVKEGEL